MSDFEAFEANFDNNLGEEDPAAEFLAREQTELAGLEDDNFELGTAHIQEPIISESGSQIFADSQMNGNIEPPLPPSMTTLQNKPASREEPEKIRKWREAQQELLEAKDNEEELKKTELRETAKKEIEEWYARYREQVEKAKLNNRNAEKDWIEERDAETPGQDWERIARLCDFNPKSSRCTKDTSRMRSIILQLKQAPIAQRS